MKFLQKKIKILSLFSFLLLYACASIGNPTGGNYDVTPPVFVRSNPAPDAIHFNKNKIELFFNEYISIEKPSEKVIITPPQQKMPVIKAIGKKISVELKDSLIANTTYTFDFTNGIVDNNEKNAIEGFTIAFSTGDVVDSLMISGILLNAENLEPMPNILVGLHDNPADSAFTTLSFKRTSSTNDRGQFRIRNVAPGAYKLFALNDMNRNYKFDQPSETIAFLDSLLVPNFEPAIRMDTLRIDSLTIDTIKEIHYTRFTPDDLVLYLFQEKTDNQYISKTERPNDHQLIFHFNSDKGLPSELHLIGEELRKAENDWYITEYSPDKKDITYWITDTLLCRQDTIILETNYLVSDSLMNLVPTTDTIPFILRNREAAKKNDKKNKEEEIDFLKIDFSAKGSMDVFDTLKIVFAEPVLGLDLQKIQIQQKVDTLWEDRTFPIIPDSLNPRLFYVDNHWLYGQEFQITVDSAAIFSVYGKWNDSIHIPFKFHNEEEYSNLYIQIVGSEGPGFGELLDGSDKAVRTSVLYNGELIFEDLKAGKYYLRYIEDTNGNGKWDTGNYAEKRQPEKVYYFENIWEIRKYTDYDDNVWDIHQTPIEKQKPLGITKNKPAAAKQPRTNPQNQQNRQQNTNTNRSMSGGVGRTLQQMPLSR